MKSSRLTLADKLSRLSFLQACDLLGGTEQGRKLLFTGGKVVIEDFEEQVVLSSDLFRLTFPGEGGSSISVEIRLEEDRRSRLQVSCSRCQTACEHMGTALSVILENKTLL
ncbi:MAG: helicase, partial [Planctomycetaceae bacterium]